LSFEIIETVKAARIPILRLKFREVLDVDLSFQNAEPLPNTQLLRAYVDLSSRLQDIGVLVKIWAEAAGVCGAPRGHLSAYSLTLMVIYFMQVEPSLCLPVLPTGLFDGESGIPSALQGITWRCDLPRAELLYRFFQFYSQEFQWGSEVISVRIGRRAMASEEVYSELRGRFSSRIHVEDPFLLARNLHCTLRQELEEDLYTKLWEAAQAMQRGLPPAGLQPDVSKSSEFPPLMHVAAPQEEAGGAKSVLHTPASHADGISDLETECTSGLTVNNAFGSDCSGQVSEGGEYDGVGTLPMGSLADSKGGNLKDLGSTGHLAPPPEEIPTTRLTERWRF